MRRYRRWLILQAALAALFLTSCATSEESAIPAQRKMYGSREELLQVARQFQLEGLVAKRSDSLYESGRRSGAWVKVKLTQQQEFVIGGYTPPERSRKYFGALLVGYYGKEGLLFAGRVGTGFSEPAETNPGFAWAAKHLTKQRSLVHACQRQNPRHGSEPGQHHARNGYAPSRTGYNCQT